MNTLTKWDLRFYELACVASSWVKGERRGVGACIVGPGRNQFAMGYSGYPRGISDAEERLANTEFKRLCNVHAELNAILNSRTPLDGWTIYCTMAPCASCAGAIIQSGIVRVVSPWPWQASGYWIESCSVGSQLLQEAGVVHDCVEELNSE